MHHTLFYDYDMTDRLTDRRTDRTKNTHTQNTHTHTPTCMSDPTNDAKLTPTCTHATHLSRTSLPPLPLSPPQFEFPAYFNYFVLKRCVTIICHKRWSASIRSIFTETLFGPKEDQLYLSHDFPPGAPSSDYPRFVGEGLSLDPGRRTLKVEDLINIVEFPAGNAVTVPGTAIHIKFDSGTKEYDVSVPNAASGKREVIATVQMDTRARSDNRGGKHGGAAEKKGGGSGSTSSGQRQDTKESPYGRMTTKENPLNGFPAGDGNSSSASSKDHYAAPIVPRPVREYAPLRPPLFGVTILGSSHGFDPDGTNTGFVVWVNGRGMIVDPPPGSSNVLRRLAIPTRLIDGVLLTHCHADHDAGTFQRMLKSTDVKLYTTKTIFESFLRKYSLMTGLHRDFLLKCVTHHPVVIGEPFSFHGGTFTAFYSLHTVPCIGFEARLNSESAVYSADTNADPALPHRLYADGVIGEGRMNQLLASPLVTNEHDLIFHEAGIPPIHTPMDYLADLPDEVKERLFLVHVSKKTVPSDSDLKCAVEWQTIELDQDEVISEEEQQEEAILRHLKCCEFFNSVSEDDLMDRVVKETKLVVAPTGTFVARGGQPIEHVFYIMAGEVECYIGDFVDNGDVTTPSSSAVKHHFVSGDIVGQQCLGGDSGQVWAFSIKTITGCTLYEVPKAAIEAVVTDEAELQKMTRLADLIVSSSWDIIGSNVMLKNLTMMQRLDFAEMLGEEIDLEREEEFDCADNGFIVISGEVNVSLDENEERTVGTMAMDGPTDGPTNGATSGTSRMRLTNRGVADKDMAAVKKQGLLGDDGQFSIFTARTAETLLGGTQKLGRATYRGSGESKFVDEIVGSGSVMMDINAFLEGNESWVYATVNVGEAVIRPFSRPDAVKFIQKYPGLMMQMLDTVVTTQHEVH